MKASTVKVKSQISKCTPVLVRIAKHNKLRVTLGKTASGMDEVTLVGDPDMIKSVRKLWADETSVKPTVSRFPKGKLSHYHGPAAIFNLDKGDVIMIAPSQEVLDAVIKKYFKLEVNHKNVKEVNVTKL